MPDMYKLGVSDALARLGLAEPEEESHLARNVALGGLAAAPFAGLIGRQKLLHDPNLNPNIRRGSVLELERAARPGDVIVSGTPGRWGFWKAPQSAVSGSHFFHSDVVPAERKFLLAGERYSPDPKERKALRAQPAREAIHGRYSAGRFPGQGHVTGGASDIAEILSPHGYGYEESVLLRPKSTKGKRMSQKTLERLQEAAVRGAEKEYKMGVGTKGLLRELFLPKFLGGRGGKPPVVCEGNVCSTLPARTLQETGLIDRVVPGKPTHATLSDDFLRSTEFEPVMAHMSKAPRLSPRAMKALQYGTRAGIGLGLAGTAYGLSEDPALAAAIPGAVAAPIGMRAGLDYGQKRQLGEKKFKELKVTKGREELPKTKALIKALEERHLKGRQGEVAKKILRRFGTRTIPLALAGGLATYLGAKGIQKATQSE